MSEEKKKVEKSKLTDYITVGMDKENIYLETEGDMNRVRDLVTTIKDKQLIAIFTPMCLQALAELPRDKYKEIIGLVEVQRRKKSIIKPKLILK